MTQGAAIALCIWAGVSMVGIAFLLIEVESLRRWAKWHKEDIRMLNSEIVKIQMRLANQPTSDNP